VCAATFALDLIKSKQTRTHSFTPHSHAVMELAKVCVDQRETENMEKWKREREFGIGEGKDLELFTSETKQIKNRGHQTSHFLVANTKMLVFYCAFKTAKCNSARKVKSDFFRSLKYIPINILLF